MARVVGFDSKPLESHSSPAVKEDNKKAKSALKVGSPHVGSPHVGSPFMVNQYLTAMAERELATMKISSSPNPRPLVEGARVRRKSKMDNLKSATPEGQALRLQLLQGSTIVFINAGYKGKRFIYEHAKTRGVTSYIIDNPGSWGENLEKEQVIHKFIGMKLAAEDIEDQIVNKIKSMMDEGVNIDGVMSFWEQAVPLAAKVAERLKMPGNSSASFDAAKNKHMTRRLMEKAGLPTPKHFLIERDDQLAEAAAHVTFPAVIKPINGLLSVGVVRVNNTEHLREVFTEVTQSMAGMYLNKDGIMEELKPGETMPEGAHPMECPMMMEEYLEGQEVDCDIVMCEGHGVYHKVTDNWACAEPWFQETGDNCPSLLTPQQQVEMENMCVSTLKVLGFQNGVFHVEAKYTPRGPRLIEVNSRMGGAQTRDNQLAVWGCDLVDESLLTAAGLPTYPPIPDKILTARSTLYMNATKAGVMGEGDWMADIRKYPDVIYANLLCKPGTEVICEEQGLPTWLGQFMVNAPTPEDAVKRCLEIEKQIAPSIPILDK